MTVPSGPTGAGASRERTAVVYVLKGHINNRVANPAPLPNEAARDLDLIYATDGLANYPVVRDNYESRALQDVARNRTNATWAEAALDAIYSGKPIPGKPHERWEQILRLLVDRGPEGATRKEICWHYGLDGGRISGALNALHAAGIIFSLPGVKR